MNPSFCRSRVDLDDITHITVTHGVRKCCICNTANLLNDRALGTKNKLIMHLASGAIVTASPSDLEGFLAAITNRRPNVAVTW